MFVFKLIAIQEYAHIEQHKEERAHQDNCQTCHTIFQAGKFQSFDAPEAHTFLFSSLSTENQTTSDLYTFIYNQELSLSELYNRPPPELS